MKSSGERRTQPRLPPNEWMHAAVASRDASCDDKFFYGVITTGVFCKPSCSARRPRRENLRFFADTDAALDAGFRACKRCRPGSAVQPAKRLAALAEYIDAHADERLTLADLAVKAGLSPSRLQKNFTALFGVSPKQYQDAARLGRLKSALKSGDSVTGAIFSAGFGSTSRVYGEAARNMGMTPSAYRAGGAGEVIHYACRPSALGLLMMAATDQGVCFAEFGSSSEALLRRLREEFPQAQLRESAAQDGPELTAWIDALGSYMDRQAPSPDLPLDLRGTAFQLKVWRFLLSVREGDVLSYGEVARAIGQPNASRAVASACAANRVGVLVPCHRILRSNGALGGYRWGMDRKRALLDLERQNAKRGARLGR